MNSILELANKIDGFVSIENIALHLEFLNKIKNDYGINSTMEIGLYKGRTSYVPLNIGHNHIGIDYTTELQPSKNFKILYKNSCYLSDADLSPYYGNIDFLLIDGEHSYSATKNDLNIAAKVLSPHGILVVDDTTTALPGVDEALNDFLSQNNDFKKICISESETFLCRTQVWEDYYMYALLEIPQRLSNDLDDLNMKIYSGDSFEPCGFLSHPYLRFEFRNWKEDLRVEYKGKRDYLPNPNTFVLLERKNLSYLNIKE